MSTSTVNFGTRFYASDAGERVRKGTIPGKADPAGVLTAREFITDIRKRTVGAAQAGGLVDLPSAPQVVSTLPNRGGRVLPRVNLVPTNGEQAVSAEETEPRPEAAAAAAYGTALPEGTAAFTKFTPGFKRVGVQVPAHYSVIEDSALLDATIRDVLRLDFARVADALAISGNGVGENVAGILDASWSVPTSAISTSTRFDHLLGALETVRDSDHEGPIDCVISPSALLALLQEKDADGEPTWRREIAAELGFRDFIPSTLISSDKAVVADLETLATAWIRNPGILVAMTKEHASQLLSGEVTLTVEARWAFRVVRPSAGVILTGL